MIPSSLATLDDWLSWQETLHPSTIDLGLERVRTVLHRLQPEQPPYTVITVGGTNGKGSCVAFLDAILRAAGYRVGTYTSPHLLRYNERIQVNGVEADEATICRAFAHINAVRNDQSLTYFEFGTLAALDIFQNAAIDVAVLEVGLGGRLDAVNSVDPDAALVVSIGIDHTDWLGPDRDSIGYEKAGIYRPGRPALCADPNPPPRLLEYARQVGAHFQRVNQDYGFSLTGATWRWWQGSTRLDDLPLPTLAGAHQIGNAAAVLATLASLRERLPVAPDAIGTGLLQARLPGRFQIMPGPVEWILDVAHNPHAAAVLADNLRKRPCAGHTLAILGLLADKDASGIIQVLAGNIDAWYTTTLSGPRGRTGIELAARLRAAGLPVTAGDDMMAVCQAAQLAAIPGDRILVFGSFHTVAPVLAAQASLFNPPQPHLREA